MFKVILKKKLLKIKKLKTISKIKFSNLQSKSRSRFLFKKERYSIFFSDNLFLFGVMMSVPIEKSLSLGVVVGGPQHIHFTILDSFGSLILLFDQNCEKSLFVIFKELYNEFHL
jgi:hypothetical protein